MSLEQRYNRVLACDFETSLPYYVGMSRLDSALSRFSAAMDTLEYGVQAREVRSVALDDAERLIAQLREDKYRLSAEVQRLRAERDDLEGLNDQVVGRLDSAIRDIQAALQPERESA